MAQYLQPLFRTIREAVATEQGASLVEYALLVTLIAVVCIVAVTALGGNTSTALSSAGSAI
jgi:pilus assembly protein Flp/PilA